MHSVSFFNMDKADILAGKGLEEFFTVTVIEEGVLGDSVNQQLISFLP